MTSEATGHVPSHRDRLRNVELKQARRLNTIGSHLVALIAIQLVLVWGLIAYASAQDFNNATGDALNQTKATAGYASQFVVEERESMAESLLQLPTILSGISVPELCEINEQAAEDDSLRWFHSAVHIVSPDGAAACAKQTGQPSLAGQPWFKETLKSPEPVSAGPITDPITKKHVMIDAFAVPDQVVVVYSTELDSIGPALDNQFGKGQSPARFVITSADRTFEIASSGGKTGRDTKGTPFASKMSSDTFEDLDGVERLYSEVKVPGQDWNLYAGISTADAFADARRALRERIGFAIAMLLVTMLAGFVIQRRFVRPVRSLLTLARRVQQGDVKAVVTPAGPDELRELGQSVNEMVRVRVEAEDALRKAYRAEVKAADELREVDEMRTAFLRAISHELRTPLTSVVGYATFLDESMDAMPEASVRSSIKAISTQSKRLERLLLDLLDVERISRGTIEPNLVEIDVGKLVLNVVEQTSANRRIKVDVKGPVPGLIDAALVERIVENLVFNAMKHTPQDANIWVRARRRNGHVVIKVEDSGKGVPDDLKDAIFEPFKQGDVPSHSPGTGIGLNLVAQFAKLHGGRAWVEDRRGGGASFRVELPAKPAGTRSRKRAAAA